MYVCPHGACSQVQGLMSPHVSSKALGHEVTRRDCDMRRRIQRRDRRTAWEDQGRPLRGGAPGAEFRRKESVVQSKKRKCVPGRGNCTHRGMEMGPQIHRGKEKDVGLKRGFQINLRRL